MNIKSKLDYRYIYILGNSRYLFRYKIGIAKSIENRTKGIENTLGGTTYEVFAVKMFFAMRIEQFLHLIYSPLSAKMRGSGKTEWFWMVLPVTPMLFLIIFWVLQWVLIPLLIVGAAYAWLHWL